MKSWERGYKRTGCVTEFPVEDIDRLGRKVKDMKALPAPIKRKIGLIIDENLFAFPP